MSTSTPTLSTLPSDILLLLPAHLASIEEYLALSATSRSLRAALAHTSPRTLLHLCAASSRVFFRPSPDLLVAGVAEQLGAWAAGGRCSCSVSGSGLSSSSLRSSSVHHTTPTCPSAQRAAALRSACRDGMQGLLTLGLNAAACGLSMPQIRHLANLRFGTLNAAGDLVDKCVGMQWYQTPNFWNGGVSDAWTLHAEPGATVLHLAVYGALFGAAMVRAIVDGVPVPESAGVDARLDFVKYCVPDWACIATQDSARDVVGAAALSRRRVDSVGPYAQGSEGVRCGATHQLALAHLLCSRRWRGAWSARVRGALGPAELWERAKEPWSWRQMLWEQAVIFGRGLESLEFLVGRGEGREGADKSIADRDRVWLRNVRDGIARLEAEPERVLVGRQDTWAWPRLEGDLRICTSGYVCGT